MMKSLLGALCLCLILILMSCRSTVQEASVIIEGAEAEKIMAQVGAALAEAKTLFRRGRPGTQSSPESMALRPCIP